MLIELLNEFVSVVDPATEVNIDFWNPQSLADHFMYLILAVPNDVSTEDPTLQNQWSHINIAGVFTTIIYLSKHRTPVGAIRIRIRRPNGYSGTINLIQIIIYGPLSSSNILTEAALQKLFTNWLTFFEIFEVV